MRRGGLHMTPDRPLRRFAAEMGLVAFVFLQIVLTPFTSASAGDAQDQMPAALAAVAAFCGGGEDGENNASGSCLHCPTCANGATALAALKIGFALDKPRFAPAESDAALNREIKFRHPARAPPAALTI